MRSRESYRYALTSESRGREEEGMRSPRLGCSYVISLAHIYHSGQGCNGRTVGPNQIGSDRGPDCSRSIRGKEVRGRVKEGEEGLGVCENSQ